MGTSFLLAKVHFKKLPFITKTAFDKFTARWMCPGYSLVSLFPFCQQQFALPLPALCFGMLLCARVGCSCIRCWGEAEQKDRATSLSLVPGARPGKALGLTEHCTFLLTTWTLKWTFWIWKVTWVCKGEGAWNLSLGQGHCGSELCQSSVCLHLAFPCGPRVNPKFPKLEIAFINRCG